MKRFFVIFALMVFLVGMGVSPMATAQIAMVSDTADSDMAEPASSPVIDVTLISNEIAEIEKNVRQNTQSLKGTQEYIKKLSDYHDQLTVAKQRGESRLDSLSKKTESLKALTAEGEEEPEEITKQRTELSKEADEIKSRIAVADLAIGKIEELNQLIMTLRNRKLIDQITVKSSSILNWQTFMDSIKNFAVFLYGVITYPKLWYDGLSAEQQGAVMSELERIGTWAIIGLAFVWVISCFISKKFGYRINIEKPTYPQKVTAALFMLVARGIIPAVIACACWFWLKDHQNLFPGAFGTVLRIGIVYALYLFLSCALVTVLFTPIRPQWRLIEVNDQKAKYLSSALLLSILLICVFSYFQVVALQLEYSDDTIFALKTLANIVKAGCIILVARRFLYNDRRLSDEELKNEGDDIQKLSTSSKISLLVVLLTLIVLSFSLFGYVMLTEYVYNRFIASVLIVGIFYIIQKFLTVLFHQFMTRKFWMRDLRINRKQTEKYEFWFGFFLMPILVVFCTIILLAMWGVSVDILMQKAKQFLTGFNIGDMHVSITSIILGIIAFFIVLFIVRVIKNSLLTGKLSKIEMDTSIRNSVAAGTGFLGVVLACLVGISVMGGSLKGLALVAGALSLGAGLGLQNIVNNFVSGIILLFERPVKIGDWVIVKGEEGIVKQVNIRSTVIETFSKSNVIIPNADILSNSLTNLTYKNKLGRYEVAVGVSYDSDVDKVKEVLLDIAKKTKGVVAVPSPFVLFMELADSSLNFKLYFYTNDITSRLSISSAIRMEIIKRFREENINIPFPQQDVYLHTDTGIQMQEKSAEEIAEITNADTDSSAEVRAVKPDSEEDTKKTADKK